MVRDDSPKCKVSKSIVGKKYNFRSSQENTTLKHGVWGVYIQCKHACNSSSNVEGAIPPPQRAFYFFSLGWGFAGSGPLDSSLCIDSCLFAIWFSVFAPPKKKHACNALNLAAFIHAAKRGYYLLVAFYIKHDFQKIAAEKKKKKKLQQPYHVRAFIIAFV